MIPFSGFRIASRSLFLGLLVLLTSSSPDDRCAPVMSAGDSSWELVENTEGIKIYMRWVDVSEKVKVRERKAEILVHCKLETAVAMLTEVGKIPKWMPGAQKVSILHRESPEKWLTYMLFGLPWPFNDRELITLSTISYNAARDKVSLQMQSTDESYPPTKGVERLTHYKASWELFQATPNLVKMTFVAHSGDPPAFPRCVQDPVIKRVFFSNMCSLQTMLNGESQKKE